jgi:hypothetical protein
MTKMILMIDLCIINRQGNGSDIRNMHLLAFRDFTSITRYFVTSSDIHSVYTKKGNPDCPS